MPKGLQKIDFKGVLNQDVAPEIIKDDYTDASNRVYKIYILREPKDNAIRYVGQTIQKIEYRYAHHIGNAKKSREHNHKSNWIKSLLRDGLLPKVELIKEYNNQEDCDTDEIFFINTFRQIGYKLTNSTIGGQ